MNALILAAGLGTRLNPLTDTMPKALVPVNGKPLLQLIVEKLKNFGFNNIVINVHHFSQQIIDFIESNDRFGVNIKISDESKKLLDTGGAIKKAMNLFDNPTPLLVHNVDILHNINLKEIYDQYAYKSDATLIVSQRKTTRYLLADFQGLVKGWTNINTGEIKSPLECVMSHPEEYMRVAFSGIHILSHNLLLQMSSWDDHFSIIDFYLDSCNKHNISVVNLPNMQLLDVGKLDTITEAERFLMDINGQ